MFDPVFWRLIYPHREPITEPPLNASILDTPKGATRLHLVKLDGTPVVDVDLEGGLPVFYRRRSIDVIGKPLGEAPLIRVQKGGNLYADFRGAGVPAQTLPRLDATVFGWVKQTRMIAGSLGTDYGETKLFIWHHGRDYSCPQHLIDREAIMLMANR